MTIKALDGEIELRERVGAANAWNAGKPLRGDREIHAGGDYYGYVKMAGHGCHGVSYEFYDPFGRQIMALRADGTVASHAIEQVRGQRKRDNDVRSTEIRIIERARELIAAKRMRPFVELEAEMKAARARREDINREIAAEERLEREALLSLWRRADLTNAEREGLSSAYKKLFHAPIERADLDHAEGDDDAEA